MNVIGEICFTTARCHGAPLLVLTAPERVILKMPRRWPVFVWARELSGLTNIAKIDLLESKLREAGI